jgi:FkbM family methyltransferase
MSAGNSISSAALTENSPAKRPLSASLKSFLPKRVYDLLRELRRQHRERRYFRQDFTSIQCGAYEIEAPKDHLLVSLLKSQPYRDLCVGISAKYVSAKYPSGSIVDVGANIGDTAAILATYTRNRLILIEGSDYFYDILARNVSLLPNDTIIKKTLVSDGSRLSGTFSHWGGTASFHEGTPGKTPLQSERLSEIADERTCFVKTDTDGYDFKILIDSLEWLASVRPAILFENQIRDAADRESADELYNRLRQIGYEYFIVWDDAGFHLVSTNSLDVLIDMNRYMFKVFQAEGHRKSIHNYDVLCLHQKDADIYEDVSKWYRTN